MDTKTEPSAGPNTRWRRSTALASVRPATITRYTADSLPADGLARIAQIEEWKRDLLSRFQDCDPLATRDRLFLVCEALQLFALEETENVEKKVRALAVVMRDRAQRRVSAHG